VDARHAALTTPLGEPDLRLRSCTRWPEKHDCGQGCLWQIEQSPESCLAQNMIKEWYQGKTCIYCGKGFKDTNWLDNKPALVSPDLKVVEWREVKPERIPEVLATHKAVCSDCHIAEGFRLEHPELVVDRPWPRGSHGEYRR
jgi:hypothetical protein